MQNIDDYLCRFVSCAPLTSIHWRATLTILARWDNKGPTRSPPSPSPLPTSVQRRNPFKTDLLMEIMRGSRTNEIWISTREPRAPTLAICPRRRVEQSCFRFISRTLVCYNVARVEGGEERGVCKFGREFPPFSTHLTNDSGGNLLTEYWLWGGGRRSWFCRNDQRDASERLIDYFLVES